MTNAEPIVAALDRAGLRMTEPRREVARLVADRSGHFTAEDLIRDATRGRVRIGRATIFRSLELLGELGLVERVDLPSGDHAYIACEPEQHHHHLICSRCGATTEVDERGLDRVVRDVARETGYTVDSHRLELYGTCPRCQRSRRAA